MMAYNNYADTDTIPEDDDIGIVTAMSNTDNSNIEIFVAGNY